MGPVAAAVGPLGAGVGAGEVRASERANNRFKRVNIVINLL